MAAVRLLLGFMAMVAMLAACSSPSNEVYEQLKTVFDDGRQAQQSEAYDEALDQYKYCIYECSSDQYLNNDSVKLLLPKAMGNLLNTYQSQGKLTECVAFFDSLRAEVDGSPRHHNRVLTQVFGRDVYVFLAYAMSRTEAEEEATKVMDKALALPLQYPTHERLFRDYAYAAGVYYCVPTCQGKVLEYGRLALDEIKKCDNKSGAQWLVALMAKLYQGKGDAGKAIAMCREGYDLAKMAQDTLGMANAKKELADYLFLWQLYEDADKYISDAISLMQQTAKSNPMVETVAYTIKAKVLEQKGRHKEMMEYLRKAQEISKTLPYNSGGSDVDLLMGKSMVEGRAGHSKDNYLQGLLFLSNVARKATYKLRAQAYFELAKASFAHGDETNGGANLDSMYAVLHTANPPVVIEGAYEYALSHYLKTGDQKRIVRYSAAINRQKQMVEESGTMKGVVKSLAQFEMEKQEKEMARKAYEMEVRKVLEVIAFIVGVALLGVLSTLFIYKRKKMRQQHAQAVEELSKVQVALTKTEEEKSKVESQLESLEQKDVEKLKAGISLQQLLAMRGEDKFKGYFNRAYPYFLVNLRKQMGHITNKEELYCMLIALGTSNEELASIFNVARSSVIVAKYRIRKKLNLAEGEVMEEYLANLLAKGEE